MIYMLDGNLSKQRLFDCIQINALHMFDYTSNKQETQACNYYIIILCEVELKQTVH